MDERQRQQAIYQRAAGDYDRARFASESGRLLQELGWRMLVDALATTGQPLDSMSILDLGCGTGRLSAPLAATGARVTGLDATSAMLAQARAREGGKVARWIRGDAFNLPFHAESFDAVISARFFHLWPVERYPGLLAQISRVLRPNGISIIEVNNPAYGLGLGWLRDRVIRGAKGRDISSTLSRSRIAPLWSEWDSVIVRGLWWPGLHRRFGADAEAAWQFHQRVSAHPLTQRMMFHYWVVARKK